MATTDTQAQLRESISRAIDQIREETILVARRMYEHPELSGEEERARDWCVDVLKRNRFRIKFLSDVPTAFVATLEGVEPGPTIGLLAEYDALPDVGHACGHHLIAGAALGAGLLLAEIGQLSGTIRVFGCPAEETGVGKVAMLAAGAFDDLDVALTFHAHDMTSVMASSTGRQQLDFTFHGKSSHASSDPWAGASALDGVLLTYQNINALRQFVRDRVRIHGVITDGGAASNVIPERASCRLAVRSADEDELERVVARVKDCAAAGALASGTRLDTQLGTHADPVRLSRTVSRIVENNLVQVAETPQEWHALASTDFGNVSTRCPSVLFSIKTWPDGTAFHTVEAAQYAGEDAAYEAMLKAAQVMALSAIDLLYSEDAIVRARAELSSG